MEYLDKKGIRSVKEFTTDKFGHTWMNAKYFLAKTLPLLFNKKAADEAMKNGQPAPAATGQEQQFTPGVMARLFPKPIVSPEYGEQGITFRFKAPEAKKVELDCEILPENVAMQRDSDGVWSITMSELLFETFKYCFVVDGTRVCDPSNMYLSPDQGFKYSIADNPHSPFNFASQGDIPHGRTGYDVDRQEAWYMSQMPAQGMTMPKFIQLVHNLCSPFGRIQTFYPPIIFIRACLHIILFNQLLNTLGRCSLIDFADSGNFIHCDAFLLIN